jgi:DNA-binding XRE family transcriptional regulator
MDDNRAKLARAVRDARSAIELTQAELASKAEVSRATMQKLERGEPVRQVTLYRVEKALDWAVGTCQAILDGAPAPHPANRPVVTGVSDEELTEIVTKVMVATVDGMTAAEIREAAPRVAKELRRLVR